MDQQTQESLALLGPVEEWAISQADIETILTQWPCAHWLPVGMCEPCLAERIIRRQLELIALRRGLTPEQAIECAKVLTEHRSEWMGVPS